MSVSSLHAVSIMAAMLAAISLPVRADERALLNACKTLVANAAQPLPASAKPDNAELQRCEQIIREWTLRDSRMSVDENGRPLR